MPGPGPPSWLDTQFIEEVLRRGGDDASSTVTSMTVNPVGSEGDNYGSAMFRITTDTSAGTRSLILKVPPRGDEMKNFVTESNFFGVERAMLSDIVPKMEKLLEDAAPGRFAPFVARCPHHGDRPEEFLVMEDLAPHGYRLADRYRGLGLKHSLLAIRTLARFHAASVALLTRDPTLQKKFKNPLDLQDASFKVYVASCFQQTADACRTWNDFPSTYADVLESLKDVAYERFKYVREFKPGRFNVIVHGDFWINNMLFRYENNEVTDMRLVDLQISNVTTPALDILYLLNVSVSEDVSINHRDLLIREYYAALKETMELLSLEPPSFGEILNEIQEFGFYSMFGSLGVLPMVKSDQVLDVEAALNKNAEEKSNNALFTSKAFESWMRRLLPEYQRKGWLSYDGEEKVIKTFAQ